MPPTDDRRRGLITPDATGAATPLGRRLPREVRWGLDHPDVLRLFAFAAGSDVELDALTVLERLVTVSGDIRKVNEDVIALLARDEPETLFRVEELHCALYHELLISQYG
jgi:hypothetical protein